MIPARHRVLWILSGTAVWALGCGPFFPDTVLDLPQAVLRVRSSCFLDEMLEIDRATGTGFSNKPAARAMIERSRGSSRRDWTVSEEEWQRAEHLRAIAPAVAAGLPREIAEKTNFGTGQTLTEAVDLACLLRKEGTAPARVGEIVEAFANWRAALPAADFDGPCAIAVPAVAAQVPEPPAFPEIPRDIRDYWSAARAFRTGDPETARAGWRAILDLPPAARQHRATWAAWMLAKTAPDPASALPFYQRVATLAGEGCQDALGLVPGALGWQAWRENDPVAAIKLYFEAGCSGDEAMFVSLRQRVRKVFDGGTETLARAAADPLAREIVTATLFAWSDGPRAVGEAADAQASAWLDQLANHAPATPSPAAVNAAWICYGGGDFDSARRWLKQAPPAAAGALWLQAKLAVRDGRLDEAARLFAKASPFYQLEKGEAGLREPHIDELVWQDHQGRRDWMRGQFLTDRAIVHVARGEFLRALGFLVKAGYHDDAAYLAERVLTTDELVGWVKANCPKPRAGQDVVTFWIAPDGSARPPDGDWVGDPMRYVLARRLAREFRFREAAEFMPAALRPLFDHYVALHRAARSGRWQGETRAVILWHLARLRRHLGMEFFGYEGAPDNTRWQGDFRAPEVALRREQQSGWHAEWGEDGLEISGAVDEQDRAVPAVCADEVGRLDRHRPPIDKRFHYRHDAAEIAWQAAALLPDNHQGKLFILHEAGRWLAARDPRAADRFYQELVRSCPKLPQGRELDLRRWFFPESPVCSLPDLPRELRFSQPDVALHQ